MNKKILTKDLYNNKYNYEILKNNIYAIGLIDILKTQFLTADFCVKYILNEEFQLSDDDKLITIDMIKQYQPHITDVELTTALIIAIDNKMMGKKIDSIDDFETYMNKNLHY